MLLVALAVSSAMCWGAKYVLVTSTDDMKSGDKIVIACSKKGVVAGALNGTNMPSVNAVFANDNSYLTTTEAYEYTINGGGSGWVLSNDNGFIGCTAAKNALSTDAGASKYSSNWVIEEISDGDVQYLCKSNNYKNTYLQFNASAKYFSNYESKQTAIQFYKKAESSGPVIECVSSLDFGTVSVTDGAGSANQTLPVTGMNLTSSISATITDGAANFSVSPAELPATGGNLKITFSASAKGEYAGTLKLSSGSASATVALSAKAVEVSSNGTKEKPYTCGDVISQANDDADVKAWVGGYILGCAASSSNGPTVAKSNVKTNIAIADDLQGTNVIAVALPSGDVQNALNIVDHPAFVGHYVKVYGSLMRYFGGPGVKNTTDYVLPDVEEPQPVAVTGVTLSESTIVLQIGETAALTATVSPDNADDKTVEWSSSDETIATVSNTGVVTAVSGGFATITVTTKDGGFTASCEVAVDIPNALNNTALDDKGCSRKILRNGHIYIVLQDGSAYNAEGKRIVITK